MPRGLALIVAWQGERYRAISSSQATAEQRAVEYSPPPWAVTPHTPIPTVLTVPDTAALATGEGGESSSGDMAGLGITDCRGKESRMPATHVSFVVHIPYPASSIGAQSISCVGAHHSP